MLKSRKVIMPALAFWHSTLHCSWASAAAKLSCRALRAPGAVGWEPLSRIPLESWVWTGNISHSMLQVTSQSTGREFWIQFPAPQLLASAWREILGSFPVLLWFIHVHGREQHIPKIGKSDCKAFRRGSGELESCPRNYFLTLCWNFDLLIFLLCCQYFPLFIISAMAELKCGWFL